MRKKGIAGSTIWVTGFRRLRTSDMFLIKSTTVDCLNTIAKKTHTQWTVEYCSNLSFIISNKSYKNKNCYSVTCLASSSVVVGKLLITNQGVASIALSESFFFNSENVHTH